MIKVWHLATIGAICFAVPLIEEQKDVILKYDNSIDHKSYYFRYETSAGVARKEEGHFREDGVWIVTGAVSTIDSSGFKRFTYYVSDDRGYRTKEITKGGNETSVDGELWLAENGAEMTESIDKIPVKNKTLQSLLGG